MPLLSPLPAKAAKEVGLLRRLPWFFNVRLLFDSGWGGWFPAVIATIAQFTLDFAQRRWILAAIDLVFRHVKKGIFTLV